MAQYNKTTASLLADSKTLYEVVMLADKDGNISSSSSGTNVEFSGASADAFGRGRISAPHTLGDYKHTYKNLNDFNNLLVSGGTVTYSTNEANSVLSTNTTATSRAVHQSKRYHHYLPGKSQLILTSFNFNANSVSCKKRIGYYDDKNGVFFEREVNAIGQVSLKFTMRSYVTGVAVDVSAAQTTWSLDKCDGAGASDFNIDTTKTQLFFADFQWLGVGRVRCGFVHNGKIIVAHEFTHSNTSDKVYWSNPNLPVRSEILNTAVNSGATMQHICSTVMSEGGYIEAGTDFEVQNTTAIATILPGTTWTPIIALRLKTTFNGYDNRVLFKSENVSVFADLKSIAYKIGKVPTSASLSGTLTWTSAGADSACEYALNATGSTMANFESFGGGFVAAGVSTGSASSSTPSSLSESKRNFISQNYDSTNSEVFVILARTLANGANDAANVWASLQWKEII
jgi:hypothetical protein